MSARAPLALVLAKSEDFDSGGFAARRRGLGFSPRCDAPRTVGLRQPHPRYPPPLPDLRPAHRGPGRLRDRRPFGPGIRRPFGPLNSAGDGWRMLVRASVSLPLGLGESVRLRPSFERKLLMRATFSTGGEEGAATASTPPPSKLPPACCGARNHAPALIVSKIPTATGGPDGVALSPDHDIARAPVGLRTLKPPQSERLLNRGSRAGTQARGPCPGRACVVWSIAIPVPLLPSSCGATASRARISLGNWLRPWRWLWLPTRTTV